MTATPSAPASLRELALADVERELANTRRTLERIPEDRLAFRPHERSWTLGEIATHLARLPGWGMMTATTDEFDLATLPPGRNQALGTTAELLATFDQSAAGLRAAVAGLGDDALRATWTLRMGEQVLARMPRLEALRTNGISHMIHHRGQLTVYLRLVGAPLPGLYGPSGDEG